MHVAKTKALISFTVTAKLICVFVFAYADCWFSHAAAQMQIFIVIHAHGINNETKTHANFVIFFPFLHNYMNSTFYD